MLAIFGDGDMCTVDQKRNRVAECCWLQLEARLFPSLAVWQNGWAIVSLRKCCTTRVEEV